jgi:hypothetical protein
MALSTRTTLGLSILLFLFISTILAYLTFYAFEYKLNNYRIFLSITFMIFLIALIMMIFTFINLNNYNTPHITPIHINTCPDYYYKEYVYNASDKTEEIICKPFIFEGYDNDYLYVLKELQPFAKNYEPIGSDKNNYNNQNNENAFYDIENINASKHYKILNYNYLNKKISLNGLNKIADKTLDNKSYNQSLCGCALNLSWNELQKECALHNINRSDDHKACSGLSKELHDTTKITTNLQNVSGLDYQNYYNDLAISDASNINNKNIVDLKAIQINLTS